VAKESFSCAYAPPLTAPVGGCSMLDLSQTKPGIPTANSEILREQATRTTRTKPKENPKSEEGHFDANCANFHGFWEDRQGAEDVILELHGERLLTSTLRPSSAILLRRTGSAYGERIGADNRQGNPKGKTRVPALLTSCPTIGQGKSWNNVFFHEVLVCICPPGFL
jgi:hypothetical protein